MFLDFDNVHLLRDNPNVPSDLEQMPNLLNFLRSNGTMFSKSYTVLISHTAGGILSTLTGLYPDRTGITVSNSYDYYRPDLTPTFSSAFKYWTSPVAAAPNDTLPNLITDNQKNTPAPWVTYTRAGCDVANFSVANTVLENNSTFPGGDIYNVYGPASPEAAEAPAQRMTDFVGIAVHCAQTNSSVCNNNSNAKPDTLPDEPGGYTGYKALFGAKYVNPAINHGSSCVNDVNNQPIQGPAPTGCGFPGFDGMSAANSLGYVAQSLESGVPVAYAYISDVHDNHAGGGAYGPGEAGLRSLAQELRRRVRHVLQPPRGRRHQQLEHALRRDRRRERPLCRPAGAELRRRHNSLRLQHDARGGDRRQAAARHLRCDEWRRDAVHRTGLAAERRKHAQWTARRRGGLQHQMEWPDGRHDCGHRIRHVIRLGTQLLHQRPAAGRRQWRQSDGQSHTPRFRRRRSQSERL